MRNKCCRLWFSDEGWLNEKSSMVTADGAFLKSCGQLNSGMFLKAKISYKRRGKQPLPCSGLQGVQLLTWQTSAVCGVAAQASGLKAHRFSQYCGAEEAQGCRFLSAAIFQHCCPCWLLQDSCYVGSFHSEASRVLLRKHSNFCE